LDSFAIVEKAIELGINVVDTADVYTGGESERILGRWVANHNDAPVLIETKTGVTADGPNLAPDRLRRQLEKSREVLGRVDLFLAHAVDPNTDWSESLPVFSDAIDRGVILGYGLSNVSEQDLTSALETADRLRLRRPSVIQNRYSLIARQDDAGVLPLTRGESLAYTPYSPLAAGLLAGRYSRDPEAQHGSRLSTQRPTLEAIEDPQTLGKIRRFDSVAEQHDVAPAALALGWLLNRPGVSAPASRSSAASPTCACRPRAAGLSGLRRAQDHQRHLAAVRFAGVPSRRAGPDHDARRGASAMVRVGPSWRRRVVVPLMWPGSPPRSRAR
jgi:aryl-alcohol dehydrogenase-like predicted oxidoreductase